MLLKTSKKIIYGIIVMVYMLSSATYAFAASESDPAKYYSKGWGADYWLNDSSYVGNDVGDVTASAYISGNNGVVRVRGFGHNAKVQNYYSSNNPGWNWLVGVNKMNFWFGDNTTNHASLWNVYNTDPGASTGGGSVSWWSVAYDILGLYAVQSNSLSAIVNTLNSSGGGITVDSSSGYARGVTFSAGSMMTFPSSKTELGVENPNNNPDLYTGSAYKGLEAKFFFVLNSDATNYPVKAQNTTTYYVYQYQSSSNFYEWYPTSKATDSFYFHET